MQIDEIEAKALRKIARLADEVMLYHEVDATCGLCDSGITHKEALQRALDDYRLYLLNLQAKLVVEGIMDCIENAGRS